MGVKKYVFVFLLLFCFAANVSGNEKEQSPSDGCVVPGMFGTNWSEMNKVDATVKAQVFAKELDAKPGCSGEAKKLLENVEELIANK